MVIATFYLDWNQIFWKFLLICASFSYPWSPYEYINILSHIDVVLKCQYIVMYRICSGKLHTFSSDFSYLYFYWISIHVPCTCFDFVVRIYYIFYRLLLHNYLVFFKRKTLNNKCSCRIVYCNSKPTLIRNNLPDNFTIFRR